MKVLALVAGLVLLPAVALAQPFQNLPANAQAAIEENVKSCDGKTEFKDGFVSEKDVNGDGVIDGEDIITLLDRLHLRRHAVR